jgi:pilus assembly protein Flp/PilA
MKVEQIKTGLVRAAARQRGASGIEYALIATMVAVVLVLFVPGISGAIETVFQSIEDALTGTG